jgi:hypothetical protein
MKMFCLRPSTFFAAVLLSAVVPAHSSVVAPSAYTASGYNLTSLTISGTNYSTLIGSTATIVDQVTTLAYYVDGTLPALGIGGASGGASGLIYRDGAANANVGSLFQFGQTITLADRIFISDLGTGDPITFNLIDSSGGVIGDYSLSLVAANFGSLISSATYRLINDTTGVNGGTLGAVQSFASFQLADFSGTTGDLSAATGIRLATGTGWDPSMVGLTVETVPEPTTTALVAISLAVWVICRRRPKNI